MTQSDAIQRLLDKQAITEVLHRYSRGVDRRDRALLATVYWPDARDDHILFAGGGDALLDYLVAAVEGMHTAHRITNVLIDFDATDAARVESYVWAYHSVPVAGGREDVVFGGRYLDVFERRAGEWRIAGRRLIMDYFQRQPAASDLGVFGALQITGTHFPADPLYDWYGRP
jgi:SnoaL-like protein